MNTEHAMPEIDPETPQNAVRIYGQEDSLEDFPVLKAFQQYIDAEQTRARKRLLMVCAVFGALVILVIAVFVTMLLNISVRNQALNDRLIEFAMKERERPTASGAPVVVQPPDSAALMAMTAKIDELQKKLAEDRAKAEADALAAKNAAALEAAKQKKPSAEEIEIKRLKALLDAEKAKHSAEMEQQRQKDLEEYRRKHYPELYEEKPKKLTSTNDKREQEKAQKATDDLLDEVDEILNDSDVIDYFDEEEDAEVTPARRAQSKKAPSKKTAEKYSIPVEVRGSSGAWVIPED